MVERVELAVCDPDHAGIEVVERAQVVVAERLAPNVAEAVERGRVDDAVVGAGLQVDGGAAGDVAGERLAGGGGGEHLRGEGGQDHVGHRRLKGAAHEPSAHRVGREVADAVGLHARLLEQPAVGGELAVGGVLGLAQGEVVLERPAFGVLGVQRLVQGDAEAAQDRAGLQVAGGDLFARAEQRVGVQVDLAGVDLDVAGVRQPGADQCPHRVQALQDPRPVIGEVLVDGVELAALGGGAVQLLHEDRRPAIAGAGGHQEVTARG